MFGVFQTSRIQGAFRTSLLGVLTCLFSFCSCDPVTAVLASEEAKGAFSCWVWKENYFLSIVSMQGLPAIKDKLSKSSYSEERNFLLVPDSRGRCLWCSEDGKVFYSFSVGNPSDIKEISSQTLNLALQNKKIVEIFLAKNNYIFLLEPALKREGHVNPCGLLLLSVDSLTWYVSPKILPFQMSHPDALLLSVQPYKEGYVVFWQLDEDQLALVYNQDWEGERQLKPTELKCIYPTYTLPCPKYRKLRNFWLKMAESVGLSDFKVSIKDTYTGLVSYFKYGESQESLPIFWASENQKYLGVLRENRLYCFDKQAGYAWEVSLPLIEAIRYKSLFPTSTSFLAIWTLPVGADSSIWGLIEVPYAR